MTWREKLNRQLEEATVLLQQAGDAAVAQPDLDAMIQAQLHSWFQEKLVVVEDSRSSGEEVVNRLKAAIAPGMFGRVIGMQNIKGTGLDFIYRFLAWETVAAACEQLGSKDLRQSEEGRQTLLGFQEFGLLSEQRVSEALAAVADKPAFQAEAIQAQLTTIQSQLDQQLEAIRGTLANDDNQQDATEATPIERVIGWLEEILDSFDAISRRRRADLIYAELVAERISPEQAVVELQKLNKRQKGGWLMSKLG